MKWWKNALDPHWLPHMLAVWGTYVNVDYNLRHARGWNISWLQHPHFKGLQAAALQKSTQFRETMPSLVEKGLCELTSQQKTLLGAHV